MHPKKGMGCSVGGIRYIMTEQLGYFSLMKNGLKYFIALRRSLKDRCLSLLGTLCQQEEGRQERRTAFIPLSYTPVLIKLLTSSVLVQLGAAF